MGDAQWRSVRKLQGPGMLTQWCMVKHRRAGDKCMVGYVSIFVHLSGCCFYFLRFARSCESWIHKMANKIHCQFFNITTLFRSVVRLWVPNFRFSFMCHRHLKDPPAENKHLNEYSHLTSSKLMLINLATQVKAPQTSEGPISAHHCFEEHPGKFEQTVSSKWGRCFQASYFSPQISHHALDHECGNI